MDFLEYQQKTHDTFINTGDSEKLVLARLALGLSGESGEVAEKVKKYLRGDLDKIDLFLDLEQELGDVLWYISEICNHLDLDMSIVAKNNLKKLADRKKRNKLKGSGDDR